MTRARLGLAESDWPQADRAVWAALTRRGDVFEGGGAFADLKPLTIKTRKAAYGHWMGFLARAGVDLTAEPPVERATADLVARFIDSMAHLSPATRSQRIVALYLILRGAAPERDWTALSVAAARLQRIEARCGPTRRPPETVSALDLVAFAQELLEEAESATRLAPRTRAVRARDGAAIMALAHLPLRIGNFATLTLGETLIARGGAYAIRIDPEATKAGRAIEAMLAGPASEALRLYIDRHRPALIGPSVSGQRLWLTETGRPYRPYVFSERIAWLTRSRFGVRVSAHRFRACAATLIAEQAPDEAGIIRPLLSHATARVADRHCNQARMRAAVEAHAETLRRIESDRDGEAPP